MQIISLFQLLQYSTHRTSSSSYTHPYLLRFESAVIEGQSSYRAARQLKDSGWYPDIIISQVGFGISLYLTECFPKAKRIGLVEWFYNPYGSDVDFFTNGVVPEDHLLQLRTWNSESLTEISSLDSIVVPTNWQLRQLPVIFRKSATVIHEGIDHEHLSSLKSGRLATTPPSFFLL